jgi:hypothetical protein
MTWTVESPADCRGDRWVAIATAPKEADYCAPLFILGQEARIWDGHLLESALAAALACDTENGFGGNNTWDSSKRTLG